MGSWQSNTNNSVAWAGIISAALASSVLARSKLMQYLLQGISFLLAGSHFPFLIHLLTILTLCAVVDMVSTASARASCVFQKKLIVDVNTSGMGNRIFAIISATVMAAYLNRELEVNWISSESCQASYSDLFAMGENVKRFVSTSQTLPQSECKLRLSQYKKFLHFWILIDDALLTKLNEECDIIYIISNQWFAPIFYPRKIDGQSLTILDKYPSPFKTFMKCLFVPNSNVLDDVGGLMEKFQGVKWLSIHARGFFDGGKGTTKTLECAKRLLEKNIIQQILFVTDSVQLEELARNTIAPQYLNSLEKMQIPQNVFKYNRSIEGHYIRDAMETALAEWFLIGEADFCMSPTFWTSTFTRFSHIFYSSFFSNVISIHWLALVHGFCHYLMILQVFCRSVLIKSISSNGALIDLR